MSRRLYSVLICFLIVGGGPTTAKDKPLPVPTYYYGVYDMALSARAGTPERPLWDISSPAMRDKMFDRLESVGINMATYAYVYRIEGPLYPHDNPKLKAQVERWRGQTPVLNFLDDCQSHNMIGFLGIHVRPEDRERDEYLQYLDDVTTDVVTRFREHPGFGGFVPPVESFWQKITVPEYAHLARLAKQLKPDLLIMDFPSGPHVSGAVQCVQDHANLEEVDIENVQFFVGNSSVFSYYLSLYREMPGFRGLTLLLEGLCPNAKSMAHTHYMQGAGRANIPREQDYRVSQNVLLTATRYGIHFFTYPHLFHGYDNRDHRSTFWRWVKWCEGVLSVQRYVPYYAESQPCADVVTILPSMVDLNGTDWVNYGWTPLASEHILSCFQSDLSDLRGPVAVLPSPFGLSSEQISRIEQFVQRGGTLISILDIERNLVPKPEMGYTANTAERSLDIGPDSDQVDPRLFRLLNVEVSDFRTADIKTSATLSTELASRTIEGRGFALQARGQAETLADWADGSAAVLAQSYGEGRIVVMPGGLAWLDRALPAAVRYATQLSVECRNLPKAFLLEKYITDDPCEQEMFLFLNTEEGCVAEGSELICADQGWKYYVYIDDERAELLEPERMNGKLKLRLPQMNAYGFVLMTNAALPVLFPQRKLCYTALGKTEKLSCRLINITGKRLRGSLEIEIPEGWQQHHPEELNYRLKPGESQTFETELVIPEEAEHETYFVHFRTRGLEQRTMLIPVDGRERIIRDDQQSPEPLAPHGKIGPEWLEVSVGQEKELWGRTVLTDNNEYQNDPGVSFYYNAEWSLPLDWQDRKCRYGAMQPFAGGANFWLNGVNPDANYEIEIEYWAEEDGTIRVWDGATFIALGNISGIAAWQKTRFILAADQVVDAGGTGNTNALFELDVPGIYVQRIAARNISSERR